MTDSWKMPIPSIGDTVLFSTDCHTFSSPCVGFVLSAGDRTVRILTFTPTGWVDRTSVHHREDPDMHGDNGWHELGCWDFAPQTVAVYKAANAGRAMSARERLASVTGN